LAEPLQLSGATSQISAFFKGLTSKQKMLMAGSAVLVAGLLFFFVNLMNKPDYKPLVSGLSSSDAQSLNSKLSTKGIHSQITPDGTGIEVQSDQLDKARLEVASGGMPSGGRMGFEIFDKPNWMGSDFAEKVNYQRALEGELERSISSIQEVESARVHLVLERESLFTEHEKEAKASVVLKLKKSLSPETANAITQLVAGAVEGLNAANVTLLSADGHIPLMPKHSPFGGGDADLEATMALQVVATLEPVLGPGHVRANVRIEYDTATSDQTKEVYDPASAVAITHQSAKEHSGSASPNGIPGTASNVPSTTTATAVPKPGFSASDNGSSSESESATYVVNRTLTHVNQPAGQIKRVSAAVLVDDAGKPRPPEELKKLESIAGAALGIDVKRGDSLVVEGISFQQIKAEVPGKPTAVDKATKIVQNWSSAVRVAGILALFLVVYLLVLRPVKKQVLLSMKEIGARKTESARAASGLAPELEEAAPNPAINVRRELVEKVQKEPQVASRLVQSWIHKPSEAGNS
jgi:flagellar M-ring protein FliF